MWEERANEVLSRGWELAERLVRKARSHLEPPRATLVYHPDYEPPDNELTDPRRAAKVLSWLSQAGCLTSRHVRRAPRPSLAQICRVHGLSYVQSLQDPNVVQRIFGFPVSERFAEAAMRQQRRMVGGTLLAANRAAAQRHGGRPIVNLGGGFHHAYAQQGTGFCVFNDVAVAIADLRERGYDGRILVVDFDLHQGDGTRRIFADDPSVFTCSIHAVDWDLEPARADLNVALGAGIGDRAYLLAITETIAEAFGRAKPDLVFYLAGVDVADDDRLGSWWVSSDAILLRDQLVVDAIGDRPSVWLLAGGYGPEAWRHTARSVGWVLAGLEDPVVSEHELSLSRFRKLASRLDLAELSTEHNGDTFDLCDADLMGDLFRRPQHFKLLGLYTPHGVECALEQYGVLEKVRRLGYEGFEVVFELDHPTGQLVRLFSDDEHHDLLVEIVVREDTDHEPYRLLAVEWLMMQNPREQPSADRPLLPGQRHPGLGVVREVGVLLVMVCERLGFDGLLFNAAHYHLAALGRGHLLFWDPRLQGRFLALEAAVEGLPLLDATRLYARGLATSRDTGAPVRWRAGAMVLPVSERLHERFDSPEYERSVEQAAASFDLQTHPERLFSGSYAVVGA